MLTRQNTSSASLARPALRAALAGALGAVLLCAAPAHAYFDNYLSGTIIGTLNDKEGASLAKSVRAALNDTADGQSVAWTYPAAGRRQQIDGTITPVESKTDKGQPCRRLKSDLKRGSAEEHWSGWFCKQSNGQWKSRHVDE
ncbi:outer membrane surface antigen [Cupriavidus alkaliphilus]|uniref:RT0821/Lpp0805 family surface protein n=1 Tax=Cupriavidus alkaliphilus TaxID=942866 RepID=UPI0008159E54|nr:RT0821/Lpp0805 family surface protein [Cupriavidus alkaliphilus]PVY69665.1 outer membrane surface antigen [Cupriavidus alkaliphilus]SCB34262.1 outer membrane surface antigen [Cupriavidus alkaliphilus]